MPSAALSDEKQAQIHKLITKTLMGVLAALYESKIVKRVNMGKIMMLFGLNDSDLDDIWIEFDDEAFLEGYKDFKDRELAKTLRANKTLVNSISTMFPNDDETIH